MNRETIRIPFYYFLITGLFVTVISSCDNQSAPSPSDQLSSVDYVSLPASEHMVLSDLNPVFDLSADGKQLVYVGKAGTGQQLYLRQLYEEQSRPLTGTNGARYPFFHLMVNGWVSLPGVN